MTEKYKIRLATRHDLASLVRLEEIAFATDRFTKDQIEYLLIRSRATTFILEDKNGVVGSACVLWRKSHRVGRLYNLAIDPVYQGKGLGAKLLKECEIEAARRECPKMTLEVRQDNLNGIKFYEKQGYGIVTYMSDYYHDGSTGIKMSKFIKRKVEPKLKFNIPYYPQSLDFTCGPACLMMCLNYLKPEIELNQSLEMTLWKEATVIFMTSGLGGTDGYGLALSALNRGLSCRLIMSMDTTPMLKSVRVHNKREIMRVVHKDMKRKARQVGLSNAVYQYGIDDIVSALHRGFIPIAMISTYRLTGDRVPHWVIVTGFDKKNIYIHDPDIASYKKRESKARNIKIEKTEFLRMTRYGKEVYRCILFIGLDKKAKMKSLLI